MATAETEISHDEDVAAGGSVYDAFISYSHAADDLLAPRLQAGLQRFAKPWWKRRALRIFRDESSLSANPHLWSSITDALDGSDWFVLLLSPEAATSEWVNQEVEYWVANKDPERIIPVLTDGGFAWANGDVTGDAVPPALHGVFSDEPRWVELRFARSEEQLDLQDPRFADAVADIAAAIRQVPKDELASEEVRQHRRTVRTAWGAGVVVLLLALAASGAALFALDQRNDARSQASIAQGRELTLEAEKVVDLDPELSIHLALAAMAALSNTSEDPAQAVAALRAALANDRVLTRFPGGKFVGVDSTGTLLVTGDPGAPGGAVVWDIPRQDVVDRFQREGDSAVFGALSPDGKLVAVGFAGDPAITVWDRATRESFEIDPKGGVDANLPIFSPDGAYLAFESTTTGELDFAEWSTEVWSILDRRMVYMGAGWGPSFSREGLLSFIQEPTENATSAITVVDPASGTVVHRLPSDALLGWTAWSPDDTYIASSGWLGSDTEVAIEVFDVEEETVAARSTLDAEPSSAAWLNDSVVGITSLAVLSALDARTGDVLFEFAEVGGFAGITAMPGTDHAALAQHDGETLLLDTSPLGGVELGGWLAPLSIWRASYVGDGSFVVLGSDPRGVSPDLAFATMRAEDGTELVSIEGGEAIWWPDMSANGDFVPSPDSTGQWSVYSALSRDPIYTAPDGWTIRGVDWDGTQAVINLFSPDTAECGPTNLVRIADGAVIAELMQNECTGRATFSPDGEMVFLGFLPIKDAGHSGLFDTANGTMIADTADSPCAGLVAAFTPDSTELITGSGSLCVLDIAALGAGASVDEAIDRTIPASDGLVLRIDVSPDASEVTTAAVGEVVKRWDLVSGSLLEEFGGSPDFGMHDAQFHPNEPWLLVTTPPNEVRIYTLDLEELIEIARSRLSRDMTEDECQRYLREPCPTS
jgi:WD40 repeat protein